VSMTLGSDDASPASLPARPRQAEDDAQAVALWLHGRPARTAREYRREVGTFLAAVGTPLGAVTRGCQMPGCRRGQNGMTD
jgi:hypothetical protein